MRRTNITPNEFGTLRDLPCWQCICLSSMKWSVNALQEYKPQGNKKKPIKDSSTEWYMYYSISLQNGILVFQSLIEIVQVPSLSTPESLVSGQTKSHGRGVHHFSTKVWNNSPSFPWFVIVRHRDLFNDKILVSAQFKYERSNTYMYKILAFMCLLICCHVVNFEFTGWV